MPNFDTQDMKIQELEQSIIKLKLENILLKKQLRTKPKQVNAVTSYQILSFCDSDTD